jgi:hypothetical protein
MFTDPPLANAVVETEGAAVAFGAMAMLIAACALPATVPAATLI